MTESHSKRAAQVLRWASRPTDDAETRLFQQRRVGLMARVLLILLVSVSVLGAAAIALIVPEHFVVFHSHPIKVVTYLLAPVFGAVWLFLRGRPRPLWLVNACDLGILLLVSGLSAWGLATARSDLPLHFAGLLLGLLMLVLRAALVPSRPLWTLVVGLLCGVPVAIGAHLRILVAPPTGLPPRMELVAHIVWWLAATGATTFVSRTIYGLITQVARVSRLGQYTLLEKIGEGGMGEVYRAQHALLRRPTAVKLLLPGRTAPETLARFEREVQQTSRLTHPNTIAIYDYGRTPDGIFYYAMEYLDGLSLEQLVREEGAQPPGRVVHLLLQVTEALAEAHAAGLVHRDVKPANVMVTERGGIPDMAKVLDFGLVKDLDPEATDPRLTTAHSIAGTPLFMSPEAIASQTVDHRADLYALGAVAYFLLTGTPPFVARTVVEICSHHLHTAPIPPSQHLTSPLPAALESLVLACLAKDPAARPRDAHEVQDRLTACQIEVPWTRADAADWWRRRRESGEPGPTKPIQKSERPAR